MTSNARTIVVRLDIRWPAKPAIGFDFSGLICELDESLRFASVDEYVSSLYTDVVLAPSTVHCG